MREEPERSKAIVVRHQNDAFFRERLAVGLAGALGVSAGMRPHQYRQRGIGVGSRGPDVDIETVFRTTAPLHALRSEFIGGAHAFPVRRRLRGTPTQIADGRSRVWNSTIDSDVGTGSGGAGNQAGVELDGAVDGSVGDATQNDK